MKTSSKENSLPQEIVDSISHRAGKLLVIISTSFSITASKKYSYKSYISAICIYLKGLARLLSSSIKNNTRFIFQKRF